jgi:hypothetical protein
MKITVNIGKGQAGKTTYTTKDVANRFKEELCVLATHPFNLIFNDLCMKLKEQNVSTINPTKLKERERRKLLKDIQQNKDWENGLPVLAGLNNSYFWDKSESIISNARTRYKSRGYIDEFDTNQIGYEDYRIVVQKDDWCQNIIDLQKFDGLDLTSATTIGAVISNIAYDEVNVVEPMPGYNESLKYNQVTDKDIQLLKEGVLRDNVLDGIVNCSRHSMINVDVSTTTHSIIYQSIMDLNLITEDGRMIMPIIVNENNSLDYELVTKFKDYSCVYIGGNMFARGATFPHLQNLTIDKPNSDISVQSQALMRIFGRKDYQLGVWCSSLQHDQLEEGRRLEDEIRQEEILRRPYLARKEWIESKRFGPNFQILHRQKNNNFGHHQTKTMEEPIEMYRELPTDLRNYCVLSDFIDGAPPYGKTRRRGLTNFGLNTEQRKKSDQEKAELYQKIIDSHPQSGTLIRHPAEDKTEDKLYMEYIIPPHEILHEDENGNSYVEKFLAKHDENLDDHWHIKTKFNTISEQKTANNKRYVISASSKKGKYNTWNNISELSDTAKNSNSTKIVKKKDA